MRFSTLRDFDASLRAELTRIGAARVAASLPTFPHARVGSSFLFALSGGNASTDPALVAERITALSVYLGTLCDTPFVAYTAPSAKPVLAQRRQDLLARCTQLAATARAAVARADGDGGEESRKVAEKAVKDAERAARSVPSMVHELPGFQHFFNCAEGMALALELEGEGQGRQEDGDDDIDDDDDVVRTQGSFSSLASHHSSTSSATKV